MNRYALIALGLALGLALALALPIHAGISGGGGGGGQFPAGTLIGCRVAATSDSAVTCSVGRFRDRANARDVEYSAVSVADAFAAFDWANSGGLDTGTVAANTWYAVHAVERDTGADGLLLSTSSSAPAEPAGMRSRRLVCWLRADATTDLLQGEQTEFGVTRRWTFRNEPITVGISIWLVLNNGAAEVDTLVSCAAIVPPGGTAMLLTTNPSVPANAFLKHGSESAGYVLNGANRTSYGLLPLFTTAATQITYDNDAAGGLLGIYVEGWEMTFEGTE